jgi:hypothetical protein
VRQDTPGDSGENGERISMRLKTAAVLAGAMAVTLVGASPALACSDKDAGLKLSGSCGAEWVVSNPNDYQIPFTWKDNKGGHGSDYAPAQGKVTLKSTATVIEVDAYRPDQDNRRSWRGHGAIGVLHCRTTTPTPTKSTPTKKPPTTHPATPTPTKSTATPTPTPTPTSGTASPATPVTKTPTFTG